MGQTENAGQNPKQRIKRDPSGLSPPLRQQARPFQGNRCGERQWIDDDQQYENDRSPERHAGFLVVGGHLHRSMKMTTPSRERRPTTTITATNANARIGSGSSTDCTSGFIPAILPAEKPGREWRCDFRTLVMR